MDLQLAGTVAIITGASRGIGRAIAETLAAEGMRLVVVARSEDLLNTLVGTLETDCLAQAVDLREPEAATRVVDKAVARFGQIDLLVNNAGATVRGEFITPTEINGRTALRLSSLARCGYAAPRGRISARAGRYHNIAGFGGRTGSAEFAIGGAVNAALLN